MVSPVKSVGFADDPFLTHPSGQKRHVSRASYAVPVRSSRLAVKLGPDLQSPLWLLLTGS